MKKILILSLCAFVCFSFIGCWYKDLWYEQWEIKCYNKLRLLKRNLEVDKNGDIVNCYDKNGDRTWKRVEYYKNWNLQIERNYQNNDFVIYYENGNVHYQWMVKNGNRIWKRVEYYENWQIKEESNYVDWELDGKQIIYSQYWQISLESNYRYWKQDGKVVRYNLWQLEYEANFDNWKELESLHIYYYDNWNIRNQDSYKNRVLDWKQIEYYENWQIKEESVYGSGKMNWIQVKYYENWQIRSVGNFKDWKENWKWMFFDVSWNVYSERTYISWKLEGKVNNYYYSGVDVFLTEGLYENWTLIKEMKYSESWELLYQDEFFWENGIITHVIRHDSTESWWSERFYKSWNLDRIVYYSENWEEVQYPGVIWWTEYQIAKAEILWILPNNLRMKISSMFNDFESAEVNYENWTSKQDERKEILQEILQIIKNKVVQDFANQKDDEISKSDLDEVVIPNICKIMNYYAIIGSENICWNNKKKSQKN